LFASFTVDTPGAGEVSRRDFVRFCSMAAAAVGLGPLAAEEFLHAAERGAKPSVIWLHFQECTGCTESLLRTSHPAVDELILDLISLDYHETLFAAAGHQAEAALKQAMETIGSISRVSGATEDPFSDAPPGHSADGPPPVRRKGLAPLHHHARQVSAGTSACATGHTSGAQPWREAVGPRQDRGLGAEVPSIPTSLVGNARGERRRSGGTRRRDRRRF